MLLVENRLTSKHNFERVKKLGIVLTSPGFVLSYVERSKQESALGPRFGFVVSTHLDKRATKRNRVKRLLRESVRLFLKLNKGKLKGASLDIVFVLRKRILDQSYEEISHLVNTFLPKIFRL